MTMERALNKLLETVPDTNLGVASPKRIYALAAPQNATAPFVIFQRTNSDTWRSINAPSGIAQALMQIDSYALTYYGARELAGKIKSFLDGFRGIVPYGNDSPQAETKFGGISHQNDLDNIDETDKPLLYRVTAFYLITYYE